MMVFENFVKESDEWGYRLLNWANPTLPIDQRMTADWAFMKPRNVFAVIMCYCMWVVFGLYCRKMQWPMLGGQRVKGGSLLSRFVADPLLLVQAVYNVAQVLVCTQVTIAAIRVYIHEGLSPVCSDFKPERIALAEVMWIFGLCKILDFADTVFIVLRAKWRQMSVLHIYHHISTYFMNWMHLSVSYYGEPYLTVAGNSFIHVVMYSYYLLTVLGVQVPHFVKRGVTMMQISQFLIFIAQTILLEGCPFPVRMARLQGMFIFTILLFFINFSIQEYIRRPMEKNRLSKMVAEPSVKEGASLKED